MGCGGARKSVEEGKRITINFREGMRKQKINYIDLWYPRFPGRPKGQMFKPPSMKVQP